MKTNLLPIAEAINAARIAANGDDRTAPQTGVYGLLSHALMETLTLASDRERAARMYDSIALDGNTVQEARRATEPVRPMP